MPTYPVDPWENTQQDEPRGPIVDANGLPLASASPSSSSSSGRGGSPRGHFGKVMVGVSWIVLVYAWLVAGKLDQLPQWVPPLFMVLIMLPFGVWERLGAAAIEAAASKISISPKK